jgi:hypothetical protein
MDPYLVRWLPVLGALGFLLVYVGYLRWKIRRAEGDQTQLRLNYTSTSWPAEDERKAS